MNIIHNDLTTENIMLDGEIAKIGDFGQSCVFKKGEASD